jgi:hypothetical protein
MIKITASFQRPQRRKVKMLSIFKEHGVEANMEFEDYLKRLEVTEKSLVRDLLVNICKFCVLKIEGWVVPTQPLLERRC